VDGVLEVTWICRGDLCDVYGPRIQKIHQVVADKRYGLVPDRTCEIYRARLRVVTIQSRPTKVLKLV
jgi:hypothetical protein